MKSRGQMLDEQFSNMNCLLSFFLIDSYELNAKDIDTIARFVTECSSSIVQAAISEGKQVLSLKEFPVKWIYNNMEFRKPKFIVDGAELFLEETDDNYYNWFKWMVEELEAEAKRQGKL